MPFLSSPGLTRAWPGDPSAPAPLRLAVPWARRLPWIAGSSQVKPGDDNW